MRINFHSLISTTLVSGVTILHKGVIEVQCLFLRSKFPHLETIMQVMAVSLLQRVPVALSKRKLTKQNPFKNLKLNQLIKSMVLNMVFPNQSFTPVEVVKRNHPQLI
jgi:hypothetical protein